VGFRARPVILGNAFTVGIILTLKRN
jgi:hypothetical protein